jgi:hypothetical protein
VIAVFPARLRDALPRSQAQDVPARLLTGSAIVAGVKLTMTRNPPRCARP